MEIHTRHIHDILRGPTVAWVGLIGSVASIVSLIIWAWAKLPRDWVGFILLTSLALSILLLVGAASVYSIRVRQENRVHRDFHKTLHTINHNYRDVLSTTFGDPNVVKSAPERARVEKETLKSVCEQLAGVFAAFEHVSFIVTIKLIVRGHDGLLYAKTHVRSETMCSRDSDTMGPSEFALKTGQNTGLDRALRRDGAVSHFYSPDLYPEADKGAYRNDRANWRSCYRSAIVVPITYVSGRKDHNGWIRDDLGFLSVDTMSENRLNGTYHVHMLAAFADQMYNFMNLMRGRFAVPGQEEEVHAAS